jgi:hypothetical protein
MRDRIDFRTAGRRIAGILSERQGALSNPWCFGLKILILLVWGLIERKRQI